MTPTIDEFINWYRFDNGTIDTDAMQCDMEAEREPECVIGAALEAARAENKRIRTNMRIDARLVVCEVADEDYAEMERENAPRYVVNLISALALATGFVVPLLAAAVAATIIL